MRNSQNQLEKNSGKNSVWINSDWWEEYIPEEGYEDCVEDDKQFIFQDYCEELTSFMNKINRKGKWVAEVKNFGWRSLDGHKEFTAQTGLKLLQKVLPNTQCHYLIYKVGKEIHINNFHHDSPVGKEWYYIRRAK